MRRFTLSFLHAFAALVIEPVARDDRTKLDYSHRAALGLRAVIWIPPRPAK